MIQVKPQLIVKKFSNYKIKPQSITLKIFFILLQIIFGIDNGFAKFTPIHRFIVKFLTAFYVLSIDIVCFILLESGTNIEYQMWYTKYLLEHVIYVFIFLFIPQNKSFCDFLENLQKLDCEISINCKYFNFKIILCTITCFSIKVALSGIYCSKNPDCIITALAQIIYFFPFLALDLPFIMMVFTFYAARLRLTAIKRCLLRKKMIKQMHHVYKSLINLTETTKKSFDPVVSLYFFNQN